MYLIGRVSGIANANVVQGRGKQDDVVAGSDQAGAVCMRRDWRGTAAVVLLFRLERE